MAASTKISKSAARFFWQGILASISVQIAACSGEFRSCDDSNASGACAPAAVKCGAADCAIGGKVCCFRRAGTTTNQTCDDAADCRETPESAEPARTPTECDEHSDCPTGSLCSHVSASGGSRTYCRLASEANVSSDTANWWEVCESPVAISTCSGGRTCTENTSAFPGWKFCAHLASD